MLTVENLTKSYADPGGRVLVLDDISLQLAASETLALTGESGSGKSTLLHLIAGLDTADSGRIMVAGQDIVTADDPARAAMRRGMIGIVFQQFNLIPSLTIGDNIAFQARLAGTYDAAWADHLAAEMGLDAQSAKYPEALSGGQQQRAAIARTLAARPKLILADEPTGNLDEENADIVLDLLLSAAAEAGSAVLMVTHSPRHAGRLSRQRHLSRGGIST